MRKASSFALVLAFASIASACSANLPKQQKNTLSSAATLSVSCSGCHVANGLAVSSLKGWTEEALSESLKRYQGEGHSVMHRYARGLSTEDINLIAAYLGKT